MKLINFFDSLKGTELAAFCALFVACTYFYLSNVYPTNVGISSAMASCVMGVLTAGAITKMIRIVRTRFTKVSDRNF